MIKFELSSITIVVLCVITVISSTLKGYSVIGNKNTEYSDAKINLNLNQKKYQESFRDQEKIPKLLGRYAEDKNMDLEFFKNKANAKKKFKHHISKYIGVSWRKDVKIWQAHMAHNKQNYFGGHFDNEAHAAMSVNLLCDKFKIKRKNPTIEIEPDVIKRQFKSRTSHYTGVHWNKDKKKWQARLTYNTKIYSVGYFDDEKYAAMKVNLLCDKLGIHHKNPMIDTDLNGIQQQFKNQTSNYTGVHWNRNTKKWQAQLAHNKKRYGGYFDHEEHAAMKVNLLCDKYKIKRKNLMIDIDLDRIQQKTKPKINQSKEENVVKTEEESILYGFKNKCENNYMSSQDDGIVTASCNRQKRKRRENSNMNDEAKEENMKITTPNHNENRLVEIRKGYTKENN